MMRRQGVVTSAAGLIPFGHLGWGYRGRTEFLARAAEYIADGLAQHQWVEYAGNADRDTLRAELAALPGLDDVSDVKTTPTPEFYDLKAGTDVVDPQHAVARRVAGLENALRHGYTGFRAVSDVTSVARLPEQRDAFAGFEFLVDQKMAVLPISALCAYDISELGDDAAGLICLHPFVGRRAPRFRLYAEPDTDFALTGEVDAAGDEVFTTALRRVWPLTDRGKVIIDAHRLDFISHRQLVTLDRCAAADGGQVVLRDSQRIPSRLARLLELSHVRVESPDGVQP